MDEYDYLVKIIIVGDSGVGKSTILGRYCDGVYMENYISTIGVDFKFKNLKICDKLAKLQIWDTAGQERFRTVTSSFYRGAHAVLLVFNLIDIDSFNNLPYWLQNIQKNMGPNYKIILLGNKSDIIPQKISQEMIDEFVKKHGLSYIPISAKDNINIEDAFIKIVKRVVVEMPVIDYARPSIQITPSKKIFGGYCCGN